MKITIEWNTQELKEFLWDRNWCIPWVMECKENKNSEGVTNCYTTKETVVNTDNFQGGGNHKEKGDWIFYENGWITLRYNWKEISIKDKNCWWDDKLFTRDEAVRHCKRLKSMHLPTIEERQDLIKLWGDYKGYKYDEKNNWLYDSDNDYNDVWKEFAEDFKLPFAGYRDNSSACVDIQGSRGYYWSSSPFGASARILYVSPDYVGANSNRGRADGLSVRCFKNQ